MKQIYVLSCTLLIAVKTFSQVASCVHGGGIQYLLDAYSASFGACNCQKGSLYLFNMPSCNNGDYYLAFEDNFDGNSLDESIWEIQPWGQGALQTDANIGYNSLDNVIVSNGTLKIIARKESVVRRAVAWKDSNEVLSDGLPNLRTYEHTSSNIWTKKKYFHGKYEVRARLPDGKGLWPAFWMFGGQRWNEIDVFDNYSGINTLVTSSMFDFDNNGTVQGCNQSFSGYDFSQWHTFTCIWDVDRIVWQVNGNTVRVLHRYQTVTNTIVYCDENVGPGTYLFQESFPIESMHIILNLAIGSGIGPSPSPDATTPFPSAFEIDYVRYYIKSEEEPCKDVCLDYLAYENTNQLPELTSTNNYISAGNNVTVENGHSVTFKSMQIELLNGFSTQPTANFTAIIEECNYYEHENIPVNFIGGNLIDDYMLIKCVNPVYTIEATGVLSYSFEIHTLTGSLVHQVSGVPTSNYIDLWDASNIAEGWYIVKLKLNCSGFDERVYNLFITSGDCSKNEGVNFENEDMDTERSPKNRDVSEELIVYPNPANTELNILYFENIENLTSIVITDINSKELLNTMHHSNIGINEKTIDLSSFSNGTYILTVLSNNAKFDKKFVISR